MRIGASAQIGGSTNKTSRFARTQTRQSANLRHPPLPTIRDFALYRIGFSPFLLVVNPHP